MLGKANISTPDVSAVNTHGISDQETLIFKWICVTVLCQIIDVFGIVTNIINIICFAKQNFKDPVNISLLGLAVSDLASLIALVALNISLTPSVSAGDVPFDPLDVFYITAAIPHFAFTRVSSWITAIITLERCLCIVAPLKVKDYVTPTRVKIIIVSVFIILLSSDVPLYFVNRLDMKFSPQRNRTIFGLVITKDRENVQTISFATNNFLLPFAAFVVLTVCTIILAFNLHKRTNWRKTSTSALELSVRNQKVAKMVVMISTLYILCFVPCSIIMLAVALEPALTIGGKYLNIGIVVSCVGLLLESINSSANIFIYYRMSSKYRNMFRTIFCKDRDDDKPQHY